MSASARSVINPTAAFLANSTAAGLSWHIYLHPGYWHVHDTELLSAELVVVSLLVLEIGGIITLLSARELLSSMSRSSGGLVIAVLSVPITFSLLLPPSSANPIVVIGEDCWRSWLAGAILAFLGNLALAYAIGFIATSCAKTRAAYNTVVGAFVPATIGLYVLGLCGTLALAGELQIFGWFHKPLCTPF